MNQGSLLLDLTTIENAPRFFHLLAMVERAAGRQIIVVDGDASRKNGEKLAAGYGIPLHKYVQCRRGQTTKDRQAEKVAVAKELCGMGPVIWVDLEFGEWVGETLKSLDGIVTLNWAACLKMAPAQKVGAA